MHKKICQIRHILLGMILVLIMSGSVGCASNPAITQETETARETYARELLNVTHYDIDLTLTESEYVTDNPTVRVGYIDGMAPYVFQKNGELRGVSIDLLYILERDAGISLTFVEYANYLDMYQALSAGEIDMIAKSENNNDDFLYSDSYDSNPLVLVYNRNFIEETIRTNTEAVIQGEEGQVSTEDQDVKAVANYEEAVQSVLDGDAAYTILDYYTVSFYSSGDRFLANKLLSSSNDIYFAFRKDVDARLISICNKYLNVISGQDKQQILLDNMKIDDRNITWNQFVDSNPRTIILSIVIVGFLLLAGALINIYMRLRIAKRGELLAKRYELLSELIDEYIFEYDYKKHICRMDRKAQKDFQIEPIIHLDSENKYLGTNEMIKKTAEQIRICIKANKNVSEIYSVQNKEKIAWYRVAISFIYEKNDIEPIQLVGKIMNVEKEVKEQEKLRIESMTDYLTGLYNRHGLDQEYNRIIQQIKKADSYMYAVLDLDDFKGINDTLGHHGGDMALRYVSEQLRTLYGKHCVAARVGGDEFVIFATDLTLQETKNMLERLVKAVKMEISTDHKTRTLSISLGAVYSTKQIEMEKGLQAADQILYQKKATGKDGYLLETMAE